MRKPISSRGKRLLLLLCDYLRSNCGYKAREIEETERQGQMQMKGRRKQIPYTLYRPIMSACICISLDKIVKEDKFVLYTLAESILVLNNRRYIDIFLYIYMLIY